MTDTHEINSAEKLSPLLERFAECLGSDTEKAATEASDLLDIYPGQPLTLQLLLDALKLLGVEEGAQGLLEWMAQQHPNLAAISFRLGVLLGRVGKPKQAAEHLSRAVELEPNDASAWLELGKQLSSTGDMTNSARAFARHVRLSLRELKLMDDVAEGSSAELAKADHMLHQAVAVNPTDPLVNQTLGKVMLRLGRLRDAEYFLKRAVELAPGSFLIRHDFAMALNQQMDWQGADAQLDILLEKFPNDVRLQAVKAGNLIMVGETEQGLHRLERARTHAGDDTQFWLNYGHAVRTVGRMNEAIEAYRKCIKINPAFGVAWWSLADLKTFRFLPDDRVMLAAQLERDDVPDGQRCHLEFALGKILEDAGETAESFEHYAKANALRRPYISYRADVAHDEMSEIKSYFTAEFLRSKEGGGCPAPDPIFIVGMPRSGSTLIEQILSSHSQVEGTMELPDLTYMVIQMGMKNDAHMRFPSNLADLNGEDFRALGEEYLERTRHQRKLGRPFFTDKSGNNFLYCGLIRLILPNAKIIDGRRHPLACGFSCYKQAFAPGAIHFAYDQGDIGQSFRDYVELMAHFDEVLPGRVHRVFHEDLVRNTESEIRRLLDFCGLPFEEQCLRPHETERLVRTSSSQQVRQPIRKTGLEIWQRYEPWLQPMKDALGDVLTRYPEVPEFN